MVMALGVATHLFGDGRVGQITTQANPHHSPQGWVMNDCGAPSWAMGDFPPSHPSPHASFHQEQRCQLETQGVLSAVEHRRVVTDSSHSRHSTQGGF